LATARCPLNYKIPYQYKCLKCNPVHNGKHKTNSLITGKHSEEKYNDKILWYPSCNIIINFLNKYDTVYTVFYLVKLYLDSKRLFLIRIVMHLIESVDYNDILVIKLSLCVNILTAVRM
jgi:hypothetical protein